MPILCDVLSTTRSVTRSAEQRALRQPTVNLWLARAHAQLHDPSFVRTPGGMAPIPQARTRVLVTLFN